MTKIELKKRVKSILHDEKNYETALSADDFNLLEKLFKFYYENNKEYFKFFWNGSVTLEKIIVSRTSPYKNLIFIMMFSDNIVECFSYIKAIQSLSKEELNQLNDLK